MKINVTINSLMQHFHLVALIDLSLNFAQYKHYIYVVSFSSLENPFGKLGFAAVISPVSV